MPSISFVHPFSTESVKLAYGLLPLVSIDVYLTVFRKQSTELFLGLRNNSSVLNWWFTLGGRINKIESMAAAFGRIVSDELHLSSKQISDAKFLGVFEHFYPDSALDVKIPTHL